MVNAWMKGAIIGFPLSLVLLGLLYMTWTTVIAIVFTLLVIAAMDWSGQGDGREGCDLHTSCEH